MHIWSSFTFGSIHREDISQLTLAVLKISVYATLCVVIVLKVNVQIGSCILLS